jgi:16S rRNA (adenine1518-N6/adenine1519-N6)-dimethyltransferase
MFQAKKSLGQHFLTSKKALTEMADAGAFTSGDTVIEIGPGEGVLTTYILEKIKDLNSTRLVAIEKDDRLIPILEEKFKEYVRTGLLQIVHGDILEKMGPITASLSEEKKTYKIVANIPYYISGILMRKIFELPVLPTKVVILVQKEVADRIVAHDKKESMLSVSVKLYGDARRVSIVPKGAFVPAPNVDSAIISIENIQRVLTPKGEKAYFELTKAAFSHKRKRLVKNIEGIFGKSALEWEKDLERLGFDKNVRAEDLGVNTFMELSKL